MTESSAPPVISEVDDYLERVAAVLADLPSDVREDLLEDLPAHFAEVLAEQGGTLVERLGPPAAYAAELRAAAGVDAGAGPRRDRERMDVIVGKVRAQLGAADLRLGTLLGYRKSTDFLRLLHPAWWVARGFLIVLMLFAVGVLPAESFNAPLGWLLIAVAVGISVRLSSTGRPRVPRWLGFVVSLVAVLGGLVVLVNLDGLLNRFVDEPSVPGHNQFSNVTDVYPVDGQGHPLHDIQLYDQDGNPIQLGDYWHCVRDPGTPEPPVLSYPLCKVPPVVNGVPVAPTPSPSPAASVTASPTASLTASPSAKS